MTQAIDPLIALKRDEHHPAPTARFIKPEPDLLPDDATPTQQITPML